MQKNSLSPYFNEPVTGPMSLEEKEALMKKYTLEVRKYPKNTTIPLEPDLWASFYLNKGCIKIFIANDQGIERLLFYVPEKNTFCCGYPNIPMILQTTEDCEIFFLDSKALIYDIIYDKKDFDNFWESTYHRFGAIAERVLDMSGTSNKGKIAKFIYNLARESTLKTPDGKIIIRKMPTRTDLALFIGSHKSNVIKILSSLEKDGIVIPSGKEYIINDMEKLKEVIDESYHLQ